MNEATREQAQSFLAEEHIRRILAVYQTFGDKDSFARIVTNDEIREKGNNLTIPLHVRQSVNGVAETSAGYGKRGLQQAMTGWQTSSGALRESMNKIFYML